MFNIPNQFMPDPYYMNLNHNNQTIDFEQQIKRLEREFRKLEHRVSNLERKNEPYILTSQKDDSIDDGMYMM